MTNETSSDDTSVEPPTGSSASGADPGDSFWYLAERDQALAHDRCFLCGADLAECERTDEHVFPQRVLRDFDLHNDRLTLPNGTTIPYRSLTIPCCRECNNLWLHQLEDTVSAAVRSGPEAVQALDPTALGLWMAKIFYGLLFKDISLAADRLHPTGDTIVDGEMLREFAELHRILQVARQQVDLRLDQTPTSVFVFRTLDSSESALRFDYRDLIVPPFLALRLGGVGLIACLLDWGATAEAGIDHLEAAREIDLHPTQFCEVAAVCADTLMRLNRAPKYIIVGGGKSGPDQADQAPVWWAEPEAHLRRLRPGAVRAAPGALHRKRGRPCLESGRRRAVDDRHQLGRQAFPGRAGR